MTILRKLIPGKLYKTTERIHLQFSPEFDEEVKDTNGSYFNEGTAVLILEKFNPIKIDSDVFNCHYRCLCNGQNYHLFIHENNIDYFFARLE